MGWDAERSAQAAGLWSKTQAEALMPLKRGKSKKAFTSNIRTEYRALRKRGKSKKAAIKQAVAIAYAVRRRKKRKKK
jgi:hypothetical protein